MFLFLWLGHPVLCLPTLLNIFGASLWSILSALLLTHPVWNYVQELVNRGQKLAQDQRQFPAAPCLSQGVFPGHRTGLMDVLLGGGGAYHRAVQWEAGGLPHAPWAGEQAVASAGLPGRSGDPTT